MDYMIKIINSHKKKVASKKDQENQNLCNCCNPDNCPLDNNCLISKIVYSASDKYQPSKYYFVIRKTKFKTRFNNHTKSARHRQNEKIQTSLSIYES